MKRIKLLSPSEIMEKAKGGNHKYIKREGSKGKYKYTYADSKGVQAIRRKVFEQMKKEGYTQYEKDYTPEFQRREKEMTEQIRNRKASGGLPGGKQEGHKRKDWKPESGMENRPSKEDMDTESPDKKEAQHKLTIGGKETSIKQLVVRRPNHEGEYHTKKGLQAWEVIHKNGYRGIVDLTPEEVESFSGKKRGKEIESDIDSAVNNLAEIAGYSALVKKTPNEAKQLAYFFTDADKYIKLSSDKDKAISEIHTLKIEMENGLKTPSGIAIEMHNKVESIKNAGEDERMYNANLAERIKNKPFKVE
jgi:hypothetical protein